MSNELESNDVIKISVSHLALGMFVTAIDNAKGALSITNPGQIRRKMRLTNY